MVLANLDKMVLYSILMKLFKKIKNILRCGYCNQQLLFFIAIAGFIVPNCILFFTERASFITSISNVLFPLGFFWLMMTLSSKPGKMIWILFIFIFFDAFELVLLYLFGESVIAVDMFLNLVTTNSGEIGELLGNILPPVVGVILLYVPILSWGVYSIYHKGVSIEFRNRQRSVSFVILGIGAILLLVCYITDKNFKFRDEVYPANVIYNVKLAVEREIKTRNYFESSKDFKYMSKDTHSAGQKEIYVMVVGETARAENFGIYGYKKDTTPLLSKEEGLVVFRDVLSQSNTTHKSVPMLLSGISAANYDSIYFQKGIITAFNEAGYNTAFFSNQRPNNSFIDFFGDEAQNSIFVKESLDEGVNVSDDVLLRLVENQLKSKRKNKIFIVLHTYGSHFNYYERYPSSKAFYKPDEILSAKPKYKNAIINAYDNTIRYTDDFLHRLIRIVNKEKAVSAIVYTSDHGEDIFDDDRNLFLHASPVPSAHQLHVPYLIWTSQEFQKEYPEKITAMSANKNKPVSSNLVTFHTLLDLSGVETFNYEPQYSLSCPKYSSPKRYYLNDHNEAMPMNEIGLKKEDVEYFRVNRLVFP